MVLRFADNFEFNLIYFYYFDSSCHFQLVQETVLARNLQILKLKLDW